jgi:hypothetical protein
MRRFRALWWCAIVAHSVGASAQHAAAQFGGAAPNAAADAERKELETYKAAASRNAVAAPTTIPCSCAGESDSPSVARIKEALDRPLKSTGLEFTQQPLRDVVAFLQEEYQIPIHIEVAALEDAGLTEDEEVTVSVQNVTLRSALRLVLRQSQLTSYVRDEVLLISTPEAAENNLITCVYDVCDLATDGRTFRALADAITACVATETWAKNGGGEAEIRPVYPGLMVISQTQAVHDEIAGLLAAIREVRENENAPGSPQEGKNVEFGGRGAMGGDFGMGGEMGGGREAEPTPDDPFAD